MIHFIKFKLSFKSIKIYFKSIVLNHSNIFGLQWKKIAQLQRAKNKISSWQITNTNVVGCLEWSKKKTTLTFPHNRIHLYMSSYLHVVVHISFPFAHRITVWCLAFVFVQSHIHTHQTCACVCALQREMPVCDGSSMTKMREEKGNNKNYAL